MEGIVQEFTTAVMDARLEALEMQVRELEDQVETLRRADQVSVICFSGEWDRLFAALTIAAGALAMGMETHLFFTFWAISALRGEDLVHETQTSLLQDLFSRMLPSGLARAPLSKCNFGGLGKVVMRHVMRQEGVEDLDVLYQEIKDLGAHIHLCETTVALFGLECRPLDGDDRLDHCGVATFLSYALKSRVVLFV